MVVACWPVRRLRLWEDILSLSARAPAPLAAPARRPARAAPIQFQGGKFSIVTPTVDRRGSVRRIMLNIKAKKPTVAIAYSVSWLKVSAEPPSPPRAARFGGCHDASTKNPGG